MKDEEIGYCKTDDQRQAPNNKPEFDHARIKLVSEFGLKKFDVIKKNEVGIHLVIGVVEKTDHDNRHKWNAEENNQDQRQRRHLQIRDQVSRNSHGLFYAPLDKKSAGGGGLPPAGD